MISSHDKERRLAEIRREAEQHQPEAFSLPAAPAPESGYYGLPVLKGPQWKWEVPAYLFVGGTAGAAAFVAGAGSLFEARPRLIRDARNLAAVCGALSPPLLISDLGKPSRFLGMFRVFKLRSPMSVGSWTLMVFANSAIASAYLGTRRSHGPLSSILGSAAHVVSGLSGLAMTTYTGVLLGVTAIPAWSENAVLLPLHFSASALGSAVSLLQFLGHENDPALRRLGIFSAAAETAVGAAIELRSSPAMRPLKRGTSGWLTRAGGLLSGPLPLALRLMAGRNQDKRSVKLRRWAAASTVVGSLLTRYAWLKAGSAAARDPSLVLTRPADRQPKTV